jgi:hypothetical protein
MVFILRTIFWLALVSAVLPPRGDEPGLGETAGRIAGAAVDYCAANPATCAESARSTMATLRIPADFISKAQNSAPTRTAVPYPQPRPSSF